MKYFNGAFIFLLLNFYVFGNDIKALTEKKFYSGEFYCNNIIYPAYLELNNDSYIFDLASALKTGLFDKHYDLLDSDGYYTEAGIIKNDYKGNLTELTFESNTDFKLLGKVGYLSFNKLLLLCKGNRIIFDSLFCPKDNIPEPFVMNPKITSSSFLVEKDIAYDGNSFLLDKRTLIPWVENAKDEGIGEWISFEISNGKGVDSFLISNGYVNYDKPYLYNANNRVKELKIECPEANLVITREIEDTSQFQFVEFGTELPEGNCNIRFTIQSVFPGEKWNDTCINKILLVMSQEWDKFFRQ